MKIRNLPKELVLPIKFNSNNYLIDKPFLFEINDSLLKQFNVFQSFVKQLNDRQFKKHKLNSGFLELNFSVKSFINDNIDDIYDLFLDYFYSVSDKQNENYFTIPSKFNKDDVHFKNNKDNHSFVRSFLSTYSIQKININNENHFVIETYWEITNLTKDFYLNYPKMNQDFQEMMLRIKSYISEFVAEYSVFDESSKNCNLNNLCDLSKLNNVNKFLNSIKPNEFKNYNIDKIDFYLN